MRNDPEEKSAKKRLLEAINLTFVGRGRQKQRMERECSGSIKTFTCVLELQGMGPLPVSCCAQNCPDLFKKTHLSSIILALLKPMSERKRAWLALSPIQVIYNRHVVVGTHKLQLYAMGRNLNAVLHFLGTDGHVLYCKQHFRENANLLCNILILYLQICYTLYKV